MKQINVLDDGFVRLEYAAPEDPELMVVNAARVSFARRKNFKDEGDDKLINFLLKHRHGTPFEMAEFAFHIRCPIAVTREWHRHRIASYNEISGRYVKLNMDFYVPNSDAVRIQVGKPGAYRYEAMMDPTKIHAVQVEMRTAYMNAERHYENLLNMGVAKELARYVLPVGIYTEFFFKTNARGLMNFLSLRNAPNAMLEIRKYAEAIEEIFGSIMPVTRKSFVENGRIAP